MRTTRVQHCPFSPEFEAADLDKLGIKFDGGCGIGDGVSVSFALDVGLSSKRRTPG